MAVKIYGIPSCDTVRKVRKQLQEQSIPFVFHDFRKDGLTHDMVRVMLDALGADRLVNRRGTTWRALSEEEKAKAEDIGALCGLLVENVALVKRPVWEKNGEFKIGFVKSEQENLLDWAQG